MNALPTVCLGLSMALIAARSEAQTQSCAPHTPGGVVVTAGRGGSSARIAATPRGVAVSWVEQRPFENRDFRRDGGANFFYGRALDGTTVAPLAAPALLFGQSAPDEIGMGPALVTLADGRAVGVVCTCIGGSAETACIATTLVGADAIGRIRPDTRQSSTCPSGSIAATGIGANVLVGSPFPDAEGLRVYGTAVGALQDVALDGAIDVPAMAAVGSDRAVYVRRVRGAIEGRLFDVRGNTRGRPVTLSVAGTQAGAPFALSVGDAVVVAFAQRRGRDPWKIHLATWRPGSAPTHVSVDTGTLPAMAPSLAPSTNGCMVLSWTEGSGRATVARAARVCNGAIEPGSVSQLSQPGLEAGDSELASDGSQVFAVWQEIPSVRGARAELRVARLGCR